MSQQHKDLEKDLEATRKYADLYRLLGVAKRAATAAEECLSNRYEYQVAASKSNRLQIASPEALARVNGNPDRIPMTEYEVNTAIADQMGKNALAMTVVMMGACQQLQSILVPVTPPPGEPATFVLP